MDGNRGNTAIVANPNGTVNRHNMPHSVAPVMKHTLLGVTRGVSKDAMRGPLNTPRVSDIVRLQWRAASSFDSSGSVFEIASPGE